MEAAVQSLKKGKTAGVDNIPAELVQAVGEDVITAVATICNKVWQTGEGPTPRKSNIKRAYQLAKDLTTVKQEKSYYCPR